MGYNSVHELFQIGKPSILMHTSNMESDCEILTVKYFMSFSKQFFNPIWKYSPEAITVGNILQGVCSLVF